MIHTIPFSSDRKLAKLLIETDLNKNREQTQFADNPLRSDYKTQRPYFILQGSLFVQWSIFSQQVRVLFHGFKIQIREDLTN